MNRLLLPLPKLQRHQWLQLQKTVKRSDSGQELFAGIGPRLAISAAIGGTRPVAFQANADDATGN